MNTPQRRCLLLAGGLSSKWNHPRYGHELMWWSERLDRAGFACWACLGDGAVATKSSASVKLTSARRADVITAFNWLDQVADGGLSLLVVSNHGSQKGLCLWGPDVLTPVELAGAFKSGDGTRVLIMGQCFGGVFGQLASSRTVVLTACTEKESSYACPSPPGLAYDEFLYQLGTALFGAPADAPQPGPARRPLSLLDAFNWARLQDRRQTPPKQETPTLFDPGGLAGSIFLTQ